MLNLDDKNSKQQTQRHILETGNVQWCRVFPATNAVFRLFAAVEEGNAIKRWWPCPRCPVISWHISFIRARYSLMFAASKRNTMSRHAWNSGWRRAGGHNVSLRLRYSRLNERGALVKGPKYAAVNGTLLKEVWFNDTGRRKRGERGRWYFS